jgi:hypothetical protein
MVSINNVEYVFLLPFFLFIDVLRLQHDVQT